MKKKEIQEEPTQKPTQKSTQKPMQKPMQKLMQKLMEEMEMEMEEMETNNSNYPLSFDPLVFKDKPFWMLSWTMTSSGGFVSHRTLQEKLPSRIGNGSIRNEESCTTEH